MIVFHRCFFFLPLLLQSSIFNLQSFSFSSFRAVPHSLFLSNHQIPHIPNNTITHTHTHSAPHIVPVVNVLHHKANKRRNIEKQRIPNYPLFSSVSTIISGESFIPNSIFFSILFHPLSSNWLYCDQSIIYFAP